MTSFILHFCLLLEVASDRAEGSWFLQTEVMEEILSMIIPQSCWSRALFGALVAVPDKASSIFTLWFVKVGVIPFHARDYLWT